MRIVFCTLLCIMLLFGLVAVAQRPQDETAAQPTLVEPLQPVYPREAKEAGIDGRITVRVAVDEQGRIESVAYASGPAELCAGANDDPRLQALRDSFVDAVKQAKFEPARVNGLPVKSVTYISAWFDSSIDTPRPYPP